MDDVHYQLLKELKGQDLYNFYYTHKYVKKLVDQKGLNFWREKFKDLYIIDYDIINRLYEPNYVSKNAFRKVNWFEEYVRTYNANQFLNQYINDIFNGKGITIIVDVKNNLNIGHAIHYTIDTTHVMIHLYPNPFNPDYILSFDFVKQYMWYTCFFVKTSNPIDYIVSKANVRDLLFRIGFNHPDSEVRKWS